MRVVAQRVSEASVDVDGREVGRIGLGLLLLVGIERGDAEREVAFMADKILHLRVFPDGQDRMNLDVRQAQGAVLSVPQFTLAARNQRGRRPDFTNAEEPQKAQALYARFNALLAAGVPVAAGVFGAMMAVRLVNSGPVTIILEKSAADL